MAATRSSFGELLRPGLRDVVFSNYQMIPKLYPALFNVLTSRRAYEDNIRIGGLGSFATKAEGTAIAFDDPVQGTRGRTTHSTFALGFRVTKEMNDDDLYNVMNRMSGDLGDAARDSEETLAWGIPNDGFAGNTHTDPESEVLWETTHQLLKSSGTDSNRLSPDVALSVSGLQSAITQMKTTLDESGRFIQVSPAVLLIHPENDFEAARLLDSTQEPHTADNQINPVMSSRSGLKPMSVPYLTDTDAWSIWAPKSQHKLTFYNRQSLEFNTGDDSHTLDALFTAHYRASVTFIDWRGTVGSQPA